MEPPVVRFVIEEGGARGVGGGGMTYGEGRARTYKKSMLTFHNAPPSALRPIDKRWRQSSVGAPKGWGETNHRVNFPISYPDR